jgi:shikimate dehydrogenase
VLSTLAGVLGFPVRHSRSPAMMNAAFAALGLDWRYLALPLPPRRFAEAVRALAGSGYRAANVTIPHKLAALEVADEVSDAARAIGAVNTLTLREDGHIAGDNTDAGGLLDALGEPAPATALVLGAGGAARAAVHGLLGRGLDVALCNRTLDRAEALVGHFGGRVTAHGAAGRQALLADCDLLVNTTSLGMVGQPPLEIDLSPLPERAVVYDVVYVPLETDLLKQAKARGLRTVDGLGMLLHQAVEGFAHWFGQRPQVTAELRQILVDDIRAKTPGA